MLSSLNIHINLSASGPQQRARPFLSGCRDSVATLPGVEGDGAAGFAADGRLE